MVERKCMADTKTIDQISEHERSGTENGKVENKKI